MANQGESKKKGLSMRSRYLVVILTAILVLIVSVTILYLQQQLPALTPTPTVEINMTAKQFRYDPVIIRGHEGAEATSVPPDGQFANVTIKVHKGDSVIIHITALDVTHGFGIQEYNVFTSIPVGQTVTVEFVANQAGKFLFYCTAFCGTGHPRHTGILIVEGD